MGIRHLVPAAAAVVLLAGCAAGSTAGGGSVAADPRSADIEVIGQGTVLQTDDAAPEFCLGGVMESYPPQCSGPPIDGWDWSSVEQWEEASGVTWGAYAVQGRWNGESISVTQPPIPLSLYDAMPIEDPRTDPATPGAGQEAELLRIQEELASEVLTAGPMNGYLFVTVVFDDGSLQEEFDERFGSDLVAVVSALRPVG